jgi:shikimate dehydrogenase
VNTVVNEGGRIKGYNTDSPAAVRALGEAYGDLGGCRVVIFGAGGAARAVAFGLVPKARWIRIFARDAAKAENLASDIRRQHDVDVLGAGLVGAQCSVGAADILVNATPVGMSPNVGNSPVDACILHSSLLVFDLIYSPERTRLLQDAEAVGAKTLGGLTMLVYQGAEALRLWTGRRAPEDVMMGAARRALGGGTR